MGNCLSDPSSDGRPKTSSAGGQRLGSTSTPKPTSAPPKSNIHTLSSSSSPAPQQNSLSGKNNYHGGRNTLGDGFEDPVRAQGEGGAREAALRAAEERQAKNSARGVSTSNPKAGVLSAKLKEHNKAVDSNKASPTGQEALAKPGDWN